MNIMIWKLAIVIHFPKSSKCLCWTVKQPSTICVCKMEKYINDRIEWLLKSNQLSSNIRFWFRHGHVVLQIILYLFRNFHTKLLWHIGIKVNVSCLFFSILKKKHMTQHRNMKVLKRIFWYWIERKINRFHSKCYNWRRL